jgi:bacterioferritin
MKGNAEVLAVLNFLLADEFTAIHTYILHAEMCDNWGYKRLAGLIRKGAIEEMGHAETHIERILFFDGSPEVFTLERKKIGDNVRALLETQLGMERGAIAAYNKAIKTCDAAGDAGTREILEHILKDEERHELFLESQIAMIETVGIANYLSEQMKD